jgi:hypothetical protein
MIALLGAAVLTAYLLLVRGEPSDNLTSLLVELAGVLAEIFLIILVVDQLAERREVRKAKTLRTNLGSTFQHCLVDLMRVNYVYVIADSADSSRRAEFLDWARFSLAPIIHGVA